MKAFAALLALAAPLLASTAAAQGTVYRCLDENQRPQYTNVKADTEGKKCTVVTREVSVVPPSQPIPVQPPAAVPRVSVPTPAPTSTMQAGSVQPASAAAATFPRIDQNTQRLRDDSRRRILEDELALEERSLNRARQELVDQQQLSQRAAAANMPGFGADRVRPLQEAVDRHERNIAALKKELGNQR